MKVSIACITFNHSKFIKKALDSFLIQDYPDYEIVVSDDCSTDDTREILLQYQKNHPHKIRLLLNEINIGMIKNFVQVLNACEGEYIAICEGDDYWTNINKIRFQVDSLKKYESCAFCFHDATIINEFDEVKGMLSKGRVTEGMASGVIESRIVIGAPIRIVHLATLMYKKSTVFKVDFWNLFLNSPIGDYPLTVALANEGNGYYISDSMAVYRHNAGSVSHSRSMANKGLLRQIEKVYHDLDTYFEKKFHKELKSGVKGHKIMYYETVFGEFIEQRKYLASFITSVKMLFYYRGSQYSFKDMLWIIKEGFKKIRSK